MKPTRGKKESAGGIISKNYRIIAAALILLFIIELVLLTKFIYVNIDSGWVAEPANNFALRGNTGSDMWAGINGYEGHYYIWLPLYIITEGIYFKLIGFGIAQAAVFNAIIALFCVIATAFITKKLFGREASVMSLLLMVGNFQFVSDAIFHNRPETAVALFNVLALYWMLKYLKNPSSKNAIISAVFATVSFLMHPLGLIMVASVGLFVLLAQYSNLKKMGLQILGIAAVFLLLLLPWALYVNEDFASFKAQWSWKTGEISPMGTSIATEYVRYFWLLTTNQGAKIPILLLLILTLAFFFKNRDLKSAATPVALHLIAFIFIGSKATYYFDIIAPLMAIYLAGIYEKNRGKIAGKAVFAIALACALAALFALGAFILLISPKIDQYEIFGYLSSKNYTKVIAQPAFYYAFGSRTYATEAIFWRMKKGEKFEDIISKLSADALVYDPSVQENEFPSEARDFLSKRTPSETICTKNWELSFGEECKSNPYRVEIFDLK